MSWVSKLSSTPVKLELSPLRFLREQPQSGFGHLAGGDFVHAPEIDRTFAQKTGGTRDSCLDQAMTRGRPRSGQHRGSASENGNDASANRRSDVHGTGVVGDEDTTGFGQSAKLTQRTSPRQIHGGGTHFGSKRGQCRNNLFRNGGFALAAENNELGGHCLAQGMNRFHEIFGGPAFGRAVLGAGIDSDKRCGASLNSEFGANPRDFLVCEINGWRGGDQRPRLPQMPGEDIGRYDANQGAAALP